MVLLASKSNKNKIALLSLTEDDYETLHFLYHSHIVFGMYELTNFKNITSENPEYGLYQRLVIKYPTINAIAYINVDSTFIPKG